MSEHAAKLEALRQTIATLTEPEQREIRRAKRELLWMVRRYGDIGPIALALLAAEVLDEMDKQDREGRP